MRSMELELRTVGILGVVDGLGYLHCTDCCDFTGYDRGYVWSDSEPHRSEDCDDCGQPLARLDRWSDCR